MIVQIHTQKISRRSSERNGMIQTRRRWGWRPRVTAGRSNLIWPDLTRWSDRIWFDLHWSVLIMRSSLVFGPSKSEKSISYNWHISRHIGCQKMKKYILIPRHVMGGEKVDGKRYTRDENRVAEFGKRFWSFFGFLFPSHLLFNHFWAAPFFK